jgi:hypothetical protein
MRSPLILSVLVAVASCKSPPSGQEQARESDTVHVDSSAGIIVATSQAYRAVVVDHPVTISGTVAADDTTPSASSIPGPCPVGPSSATTSASAPTVVVWADGLTEGKAPPVDNRSELESVGCELAPRIQAVRTHGAVNVINDDRAIHHLVFIRLGTHDTLQVMPFANGGEIVATDRLTRTPGIVEVRCVEHPWTRGYIAVFDHPYFTVAAPGGEFSIDSVPAGEHAIMSWREGQLRPTKRAVTVGAPVTKITIP